MNDLERFVYRYLPLKIKGEKSLSDIRKELKTNSELNEQDVNWIIREISDREMEDLQKNPDRDSGFFNQLLFLLIFIALGVAIIVICVFFLLKGYENKVFAYAPQAFIIAAVILLVRNFIQLLRLLKRKRDIAREDVIDS